MTDRKGNSNSAFKILWASSHAKHERQNEDYYATDPKAVTMLFELEEFSNNIREPACWEWHLSKEMERLWKNVYSTDLIDRWYWEWVIDFLNSEYWEIIENTKWRDIITNPPYKYAEDFIRKSMNILNVWWKCAMFLKIQFLEGKKRKEMFKKYPPKIIYVSSSRIACMMNWVENKNSSAVCYARYVRHKWYAWDTIIKWFN